MGGCGTASPAAEMTSADPEIVIDKYGGGAYQHFE
jgi:hypothetical protein